MCTVTFIPRDEGYYLAMNRDEQLKRIAGLPPRQRFIGARAVLYPSEPGGGTWISLNDARACFALVNWYAVARRVETSAVSRGEVVKWVSPTRAPEEAEESLVTLPLHRINPFRLIGIFPDSLEVIEWRWDLKTFIRQDRDWKAQQWISSGYNERKAQIFRGLAFQEMGRGPSAGTLEWLRQLHGSHSPKPGPFSTCMHRKEAGTVSYTEVISGAEELRMTYRSGPPCQHAPVSSSSLSVANALARN